MRMKTLNVSYKLFLCAIFCSLSMGLAQGQRSEPQSTTPSTAEIANAISKLRSGEFSLYHIGLLGDARATEAIGDLEKQFTVSSDLLEKAKIAQVLLILGDRKDAYWDYLADSLNSVLDSDAPSAISFDSNGKHERGPSKEFTTWAHAHGRSPDQAAEDSVYVLPGLVMIVGSSGDSRAVPLLRRAMTSPNYQIEAAAALGLAEMHDVESVPLIISRCKQAPAETAGAIAQALVYFDEPQAQSAVDAFIPKEHARILREARAKGESALSHK